MLLTGRAPRLTLRCLALNSPILSSISRMAYYLGVPSPATIIGTLTSLLILDILAVALRFVVRKSRKQRLQADDWLTIPALIVTIGMSTNLFWGVRTRKLGYPIHTTLDNMAPGVPTRKHDYAAVTLAPAALSLIKASCLCLYRRHFVVDKTNPRDLRNLFFAFSITVISLWGASLTLTYVFACGVRWELISAPPWETYGHCIDPMKLGYFFMYSDFVTDVLVVIIPIPFVWRMRLSWRTKCAVLCVFLLGAFTTVCSLLRMLFMLWSFEVGIDPTLDEGLMTTVADYWFTVEAHVGLLAACLPTLPGLFKGTKLGSSFKSWWSSSTGASRGLKSGKSGGIPGIDSEKSVAFINEDILRED
ncbi:unnamed protein product [Periconia digitata]|uniref:Rhodopsin domain-containing protein n=1 Tax=Periconia digitata TaxID=1303443 RepID=A0A9W4UK27_9PLEO|nr:unnamed protein product [Periconia digitata]